MNNDYTSKKVMVVFGTRPEAIKMAPLIKLLEKEKKIILKICVTAQHREMLDSILEIFEITPDYDLDLMRSDQGLTDITIQILKGMESVLVREKPDLILVHGDTTTTVAAALSAFYQKIPIGHVEAGLRTFDIYNPWPEEANRQITGVLTTLHFAPTELSKRNLISEGKAPESISVTGNTVIDALFFALDKIDRNKLIKNSIINNIENYYPIRKDKKFVLITGHRRENFGKDFLNICEAIRCLAERNKDVDFVYPVHLNPNVQKPVNTILRNIENVYLLPPLPYLDFIYLMRASYLVITDSGGIQEEAPALGKPVLVMRSTTERPEAIEVGTAKLVGSGTNEIVIHAQQLLDNRDSYLKMSSVHNPYGDGNASNRIMDFLKRYLES